MLWEITFRRLPRCVRPYEPKNGTFQGHQGRCGHHLQEAVAELKSCLTIKIRQKKGIQVFLGLPRRMWTGLFSPE